MQTTSVETKTHYVHFRTGIICPISTLAFFVRELEQDLLQQRAAFVKANYIGIIGQDGRATASNMVCHGFNPCLQPPQGVAMVLGPKQSGWLTNQLGTGNPSLVIHDKDPDISVIYPVASDRTVDAENSIPLISEYLDGLSFF
jgi:hypothetical protein